MLQKGDPHVVTNTLVLLPGKFSCHLDSAFSKIQCSLHAAVGFKLQGVWSNKIKMHDTLKS